LIDLPTAGTFRRWKWTTLEDNKHRTEASRPQAGASISGEDWGVGVNSF